VATRAFPVAYSTDVERAAAFYRELLGFEEHFRLPSEGEAGYVGLRRGSSELAIVDAGWPRDQLGFDVGPAPRFEMFVYVDDIEAAVAAARARGSEVLKEPTDMPWGERLAYVTDPDGNPVALAVRSQSA
jgi:lactoylglutathione lyase